MSERTQPTRAVCFGTKINEPGRECALPDVCSDSNRCVVEELRGRGFAVIPPVPGSWPPQPMPIELGYILELHVPLGQPEPEPWPDWLPCDGRALRIADYPELFDRLKYAYGAGNVSGTFRIPDLGPLRRMRVRP